MGLIFFEVGGALRAPLMRASSQLAILGIKKSKNGRQTAVSSNRMAYIVPIMRNWPPALEPADFGCSRQQPVATNSRDCHDAHDMVI
jgi:hypothetical protein